MYQVDLKRLGCCGPSVQSPVDRLLAHELYHSFIDITQVHYSNIIFQIVDVVPAVIGNVFARAVAHEWQVSNSSHQNGSGQLISQNGNSTAVSNSVSSSKGISTPNVMC